MEIRVILFEDLELIREYLEQVISSDEGLKLCGSFSNAQNLLKRIEESNPDVVLMDIQMPGISGIQATQIVKSKFPTVQIIIQTVLDDDHSILESILAGASGFLLKNASSEKIISSIKEVYDGGSPFSPTVARKILYLINNKQEAREDFSLTERELEILKCMKDGMSLKIIAESCFISIDTVKTHIRNIYQKLHVNSRSEAMIKAIKNKIV